MEKRKIIKGLLLLSLILCFGAVPIGAQGGGGKAEPLRIEFRRGLNSSTVKGKVRRDEQAEFVFTARQGQRVTVLLSSTPVQSAHFDLRGPDDEHLKLEDNGYKWSGVAPATGDYLIFVRKQDAIKSSRFSLTLIIK